MNSQTLSRHDETYAKLLAQYIASLTGKLASLDRAMRLARGGDAAGLAEAREVAHRMRGTAGCYGLRDLSNAAALLDDTLTAIQRGDGGNWEEAESSASLVQLTAEAALTAS